MAHRDKKITTLRTVLLGSHPHDHHLEGYGFDASDGVPFRGGHWLPVREHEDSGPFHLRRMRDEGERGYRPELDDIHGAAYRPAHPSMTAEDVEGAVYAEDNGTHWLFAHCSPEEQVDFAAEARTFAVAQFATPIANANAKAAEATNPTTRATAVAKATALIDFASAVGAMVQQTVTAATLGHYHRNPHNDHKRDLTVDAVNAVLASWKKEALTNTSFAAMRGHVTTAAAFVTSHLTQTHTIEWRHERAARLEAEKKKKAAAAEAEAETETGTESQGD